MLQEHIKIRKASILYILFFAAFIRPEYLVRIQWISVFYHYYRVLVVGGVFFFFFMKRKHPTKYTFMWIIFEIWILVITLVRGGNISFAINQALTICAIALFWQMYADDMYGICKALYYLLAVLIIINFVTLLIFPNGMYVTGVTNTASENWFLGFKNKHVVYFLPFVGLNFLLGKIEGFNWKKLLLIVVVVFSSLYANSSTTIVCLSIMLLIGFVPFIREHYKVFNMYTYFGVSILMFIMIPVLRLQYLFSYFIVTVLKKSIDLTYRTDLWDRAFSEIREHLLTGWGEQSVEIKHALYNSQSILSAHNQILEYIYIGGIILLVIYIIINLMLCTKLHRLDKSELVQIASGIYFALQIGLVVEVYTDSIIYMIYFLLWYIDRLIIVDKTRLGGK